MKKPTLCHASLLAAFLLARPGVAQMAPLPTPTPPVETAPETPPLAPPTAYIAPADVIDKIKDEGLNHSELMTTLAYLTEAIGPRLTGSSQLLQANLWTRDVLNGRGTPAHLESWGPFGRGWMLKEFSAQMETPYALPIIAYPKAWSPSTRGVAKGEIVVFDAKTEADFARYKGKLRGKIVLLGAIRDVKADFTPRATRLTDAELLEFANSPADSARVRPPRANAGANASAGANTNANTAPAVAAPGSVLATPPAPNSPFNPPATPGTPPAPAIPLGPPAGTAAAAPIPPGTSPNGSPNGGPNGGPPTGAALLQRLAFNANRLNFLKQEGVAVIADNSGNGSGGTVFVAQASVPQDIPTSATAAQRPRLQPYDKRAEARMLPQMTLASEHFNRLVRLVNMGMKPVMSVNIAARYEDKNPMAYNTIAEISGTDLKDEIVMLGGHMDSWQGGTGATDNACNIAVAMEAMRILKKLGLQPRRTIRVALWTGEEEGLLGSAAYVKAHFGEMKPVETPVPVPVAPPQNAAPGTGAPADRRAARLPRETLLKGAEYDRFSAYYNLDNGSGKIRGIYAQGNASAAPLFQQWLAPFAEMGAKTVTLRNTGSTDHISFDRVGLPGFQFIQDDLDYFSFTHHSTQDVYERVQEDDVKFNAVVMAAFVYQTAMMDEKMPRKPLNPRPVQGR